MGRHKVGLIIPHPEDQKWDSVWKLFRTPHLNLPAFAALIPEDEWDIDIQDEIVAPLNFDAGYDVVFITVTTVVAVRSTVQCYHRSCGPIPFTGSTAAPDRLIR
jgi:hypothetical protein